MFIIFVVFEEEAVRELFGFFDIYGVVVLVLLGWLSYQLIKFC